MIRFLGRIPFVAVVLVAGVVAIVLTAVLTSWWVLLALIPPAMMLGCVAMMAGHRRIPGAPRAARFGCCAVASSGGGDPERKGPHARPTGA